MGSHILFIKDVEAAHVVSVGDALGSRERLKLGENAAVDRIDQRLAQPQRIQLEVHLEQRVDNLQQRQPLALVACSRDEWFRIWLISILHSRSMFS